MVDTQRWPVAGLVQQIEQLAEDPDFDPDEWQVEITEADVLTQTGGQANRLDEIGTSAGIFPVLMSDRTGVFRKDG